MIKNFSEKQFLYHYTRLIDYCCSIDFDATNENLSDDFSDGNQTTNNYLQVINNTIFVCNAIGNEKLYNYCYSVLDLVKFKSINDYKNEITISIISSTIERIYNNLFKIISKNFVNDFEIYEKEFLEFQNHFNLKNKQFD
jgi:hypothetical protein